mgnify:CR=1 FL=1
MVLPRQPILQIAPMEDKVHAAAATPRFFTTLVGVFGAFLGQQQAKPGFARDKELVQVGERIYRGGIAEKAVPGCAGRSR